VTIPVAAVFVYAHVGVEYNELVDELASVAATLERTADSPTEKVWWVDAARIVYAAAAAEEDEAVEEAGALPLFPPGQCAPRRPPPLRPAGARLLCRLRAGTCRRVAEYSATTCRDCGRKVRACNTTWRMIEHMFTCTALRDARSAAGIGAGGKNGGVAALFRDSMAAAVVKFVEDARPLVVDPGGDDSGGDEADE